jgi:hypothetical protein
MRKQIVTINNKKYDVKERKIREIQPLITEDGLALFSDIQKFMAADDKEANVASLFEAAFESFCERGPEFFPGLTKEDFTEMYPSDIEELAKAFVNVNFTGVRQLMEKLLPIWAKVGDYAARSTPQPSPSDSQN